ncbi:hypothetical protein Dimus_012024 [Dionaea muscipula]
MVPLLVRGVEPRDFLVEPWMMQPNTTNYNVAAPSSPAGLPSLTGQGAHDGSSIHASPRGQLSGPSSHAAGPSHGYNNYGEPMWSNEFFSWEN